MAFGCDFDGIDKTPAGIRDVSDLFKVAGALKKEGIPDETLQALCYGNAERFILANL